MTAAVLAVHVLGIGHFALFAHSRCEHGELVHGAHSHGPPSQAARSESRIVDAIHDDSVDPEATPGDAPDGHDHCEGTGITPILAAAAPACPSLTLLEAFEPLPVGQLPAGVRAVALLSLAPKSSPPV